MYLLLAGRNARARKCVSSSYFPYLFAQQGLAVNPCIYSMSIIYTKYEDFGFNEFFASLRYSFHINWYRNNFGQDFHQNWKRESNAVMFAKKMQFPFKLYVLEQIVWRSDEAIYMDHSTMPTPCFWLMSHLFIHGPVAHIQREGESGDMGENR